MRAVLALHRPSAPGVPATWWRPASLPADPDRPTSAAAERGLVVLPERPSWAAQVGAARAALVARPVADRRGGAGLATTSFPAQCAAQLATPGTLYPIPPGREAAILAPLPVGWLPGLTAIQARDLQTLRIFTLGDLAAVPPALLAGIFGPASRRWLAWAGGAEAGLPRPVPDLGLPAFVAQRDLARATGSRLLGPADLVPLTADLAAQLAAAGRAARTVQVTLGLVDGTTATRTTVCTPPATTDAALGAVAWPLLAALLRSHRRRPVTLSLAAPATGIAATQAPLPWAPACARYGDPLPALVAALQARFGPQVIGYGLPVRSA